MSNEREVSRAARVADIADLKDVTLRSATFSRQPKPQTAKAEVELGIGEVTHSMSDMTLDVVVPFSVRISAAGAEEGIEPFTVGEAEFELNYQLSGSDVPTEEELEGFSEVNALYNAWPYWRELVNDMTRRLGMPRLTIPVLRVRHGQLHIGEAAISEAEAEESA